LGDSTRPRLRQKVREWRHKPGAQKEVLFGRGQSLTSSDFKL